MRSRLHSVLSLYLPQRGVLRIPGIQSATPHSSLARCGETPTRCMTLTYSTCCKNTAGRNWLADISTCGRHLWGGVDPPLRAMVLPAAPPKCTTHLPVTRGDVHNAVLKEMQQNETQREPVISCMKSPRENGSRFYFQGLNFVVR